MLLHELCNALSTTKGGAIQNQLGTLIGESTARTMMETGRQQKAGGGFLPEIAGIALVLFGAAGVFGELQDAGAKDSGRTIPGNARTKKAA